MAIDFNAEMNNQLRQAGAGSRMRIPSMGANPQKGLPPAYSTGGERPNPNVGNVLQGIGNFQGGGPSPAEMMGASANPVTNQSAQPSGLPGMPGNMRGGPMPQPQPPQRQPMPRMPQQPPGQPVPMQPGQMGPTPPGMPGQPQPPRYTIQPPGTASRPEDYAYEPQPDRAWKMYPPGVPSPEHGYQISLPRAASTADLGRMSTELGQYMNRREQIRSSTQAPALPGFASNEVQGY